MAFFTYIHAKFLLKSEQNPKKMLLSSLHYDYLCTARFFNFCQILVLFSEANNTYG